MSEIKFCENNYQQGAEEVTSKINFPAAELRGI